MMLRMFLLLLVCQHTQQQHWQEATHVRSDLGVCRRTYAALTTNLHSRRLAKATYKSPDSKQSWAGDSKTFILRNRLKSKMSYLTAQIFHFNSVQFGSVQFSLLFVCFYVLDWLLRAFSHSLSALIANALWQAFV